MATSPPAAPRRRRPPPSVHRPRTTAWQKSRPRPKPSRKQLKPQPSPTPPKPSRRRPKRQRPRTPRSPPRSNPQVTQPRDDARLLSSLVGAARSEEHTSELQSLMRISSAVFSLKRKQPRPRPDTR